MHRAISNVEKTTSECSSFQMFCSSPPPGKYSKVFFWTTPCLKWRSVSTSWVGNRLKTRRLSSRRWAGIAVSRNLVGQPAHDFVNTKDLIFIRIRVRFLNLSISLSLPLFLFLFSSLYLYFISPLHFSHSFFLSLPLAVSLSYPFS